MAGSVSEQDKPNRALWLAAREGKIELSCPLGITCLASREKNPRKPNNKSFISQAWGQDGWILASFFFLRVYGPRHVKKMTWSISSHLERTLGQWPIFSGQSFISFSCAVKVGVVVVRKWQTIILPRPLLTTSVCRPSTSGMFRRLGTRIRSKATKKTDFIYNCLIKVKLSMEKQK